MVFELRFIFTALLNIFSSSIFVDEVSILFISFVYSFDNLSYRLNKKLG